MATEIPHFGGQKSADSPCPPSTAASGAEQRDEISLLDLLIYIGRRKRLVLQITAVCAFLAILITLLLPKSYTATVTLLPPQQSSSMGAAIASQLGNLGGVAALAGGSLGIKNPNDMFVAMLRSRTVEDSMVQRFGLMHEYKQRYPSDARRALEDHSKVDGSGKDNLIYISIEDHDPHRAAELANGYVDEFRQLSDHLAITEASQRRLFFEKQLEQAKDNLADAEEALKLTEQKTGLIQLDSQARSLIESASVLRAQIVAKEVQIQSIRAFANSENSQLIQAQQELEALHVQLAKLGGSENNNETSLMVPEGQVPEASLEYVRKLRDVKYREALFDILARQFEVAKLDEAKQGAPIQVVDPAIPPDKKSFPKRGLIVIGSTTAGFFFGGLVALFLAGFEQMKNDAETASKIHLLCAAFSFRKRENSL